MNIIIEHYYEFLFKVKLHTLLPGFYDTKLQFIIIMGIYLSINNVTLLKLIFSYSYVKFINKT